MASVWILRQRNPIKSSNKCLRERTFFEGREDWYTWKMSWWKQEELEPNLCFQYPPPHKSNG